MIRFACPGCEATFTVGDEKAGKAGRCPKCQAQFVIPAATDPGAVSGADAFDASSTPLTPNEPPPPLLTRETPPASTPPPAPVEDPNQPVEVQPCPSCHARLSVLPSDLGLDVECPSCRTIFMAVAATTPPPPSPEKSRTAALERLGAGGRDVGDGDDERRTSRRRHRRDEVDDDDGYRPRRRSRLDDQDEDADDDQRPRRSRYRDEEYEDRPSRRKSNKPGNVATIGVLMLVGGIIACLTFLGLGAASTGLCCLWPGTYFELVAGIFAIIAGSNLLGQNPTRKAPRAAAVMMIICIVNLDVLNLILGIISLVIMNQPDMKRYFREE